MPMLKRLLIVLAAATATLAFVFTGTATAAGATSPGGPVATTSATKPEYRIFTLSWSPYPAKTSSYFFYANSTPWLRHLKWRNWGSRRAVARGRYVLDCGLCGPTREVYRAKVELKGRMKCTGYYKRFRSYKRMKVTVSYPESEGGTRSTTLYAGCPPADNDPYGS